MFNQINFHKLLDKKYLFETFPNETGLYQYLYILFGLMIAGAVASYLLKRKSNNKLIKHLYAQMFGWLLTIGLIGPLLLFFRYQQIAYLGSRIILLVLMLAFVIWGIYILYIKLIFMPGEIIKQKAKEKYEKYLPRHKAGLPNKKGK